jgi:hypothetical protein
MFIYPLCVIGVLARKTTTGDDVKTYLSIWFNSNGEKPSEVTRKLSDVGFKALRGNFDYEYSWGHSASVDEILTMGDKVQKMLKNCNVLFKLETV